jgi:glyoxylase-like metal-dependent hydrolase (beta-lactamase superfamily II)
MNPAPTGQVAEKVYAATVGSVSMFLYANGEHVIAIDATSSTEPLRQELGHLPIAPESVTHLFLTHADTDHTGGLDLFSSAQIYLSRDEEQMIDGRTVRMLWFYRNPRIDRPYTLLDDGDTVTVGPITVRAIATPGHTPGAISYLVDNHVLFSGDTIALRKGVAHPFFRLANMDTARAKASIRVLARLENVALLCTAHTGCTAQVAEAMSAWR